MTDELIPITDEQAKAIQESAKLARDALGVIKSLAGELRELLGTAPEDLVGLLGGDWLRIKRAENMAKMVAKARERLRARGISEPEPMSLSVALPMLRAASDESRAELQDLWARLLANARDPARARYVRQEFTDIVKRLNPTDAAVLDKMSRGSITINQNMQFAHFAGALQLSEPELTTSILYLFRLDLILCSQDGPLRSQVISLSPTAQILMAALSD